MCGSWITSAPALAARRPPSACECCLGGRLRCVTKHVTGTLQVFPTPRVLCCLLAPCQVAAAVRGASALCYAQRLLRLTATRACTRLQRKLPEGGQCSLLELSSTGDVGVRLSCPAAAATFAVFHSCDGCGAAACLPGLTCTVLLPLLWRPQVASPLRAAVKETLSDFAETGAFDCAQLCCSAFSAWLVTNLGICI